MIGFSRQKFSQFLLAPLLISGCAQPIADKPAAEEAGFYGRFDPELYERFPQLLLEPDDQLACESSFLSQESLFKMIDEYVSESRYHAYQALDVTPCSFSGEFSHEGETLQFLWYPSGYLELHCVSCDDPNSRYFICPGEYKDEMHDACFSYRMPELATLKWRADE